MGSGAMPSGSQMSPQGKMMNNNKQN